MASNGSGDSSGNSKKPGDGLTPKIAKFLLDAVEQRDANMELSKQPNCPTTSRILKRMKSQDGPSTKVSKMEVNETRDYDCDMSRNGDARIVELFFVDSVETSIKKEFPITANEFKGQMGEIVNNMQDEEIREYSNYMNELRIRDFDKYVTEVETMMSLLKISRHTYKSVQKNDPHIHIVSCMHALLLRLVMFPYVASDRRMFRGENGVLRTMMEELEEYNIDPTLLPKEMGVSADLTLFKNFDNFKKKFIPFGIPSFKKMFLSVDNELLGEPFADSINLATEYLEGLGNQTAELRITLHGSFLNELNIIAQWFDSFVEMRPCFKVIIQVPRRFHELLPMPKGEKNSVNSFGDFLYNIFSPIFENLRRVPITDEAKLLRKFLDEVSGFDTVDLESLLYDPEEFGIEPEQWKIAKEPCDAYYDFYFFKLIAQINFMRSVKGLTGSYSYRPHAGEDSNGFNLAAAYLTATSINHGTVLRFKENCVLLYLFYLSQVGVTMAVRSNMWLCCPKKDSPIEKLQKMGLLVTCSTDDPLIFNDKANALDQEYETIKEEFLRMSDIDMSELARNSIIVSSFSDELKTSWLCKDQVKFNSNLEFPNNPLKTNIPDERMAFRLSALEKHVSSLKLY